MLSNFLGIAQLLSSKPVLKTQENLKSEYVGFLETTALTKMLWKIEPIRIQRTMQNNKVNYSRNKKMRLRNY